jgi:hypothetical protein
VTNFSQQHHEMCLDKTYSSGAEEWYCPECGRRFVIQWPPKYKRIVLNAGDDYAAHRGDKGGLKIGNVQAAKIEDPTEDLNLNLWEEWFNDLDFGKRWSDNSIDLQ